MFSEREAWNALCMQDFATKRQSERLDMQRSFWEYGNPLFPSYCISLSSLDGGGYFHFTHN